MQNIFDIAFTRLVKTDFNSRQHVVMDWVLALSSLGFGIYAWMVMEWSFIWVVGGILSVVLAIVRPIAWIQRKLLGMIKRPSN